MNGNKIVCLLLGFFPLGVGALAGLLCQTPFYVCPYFVTSVGFILLFHCIRRGRSQVLHLYSVQLFILFFWNLFYKLFQWRLFAFCLLLLLIVLMLWMTFRLFSLSYLCAFAQFPYLIWLFYTAFIIYKEILC